MNETISHQKTTYFLCFCLQVACCRPCVLPTVPPSKLACSQRTNGANEGQRTTAVGPPGPESLHTHLRPSQRDHLEHLICSQQGHLEPDTKLTGLLKSTCHLHCLIGAMKIHCLLLAYFQNSLLQRLTMITT